MCMYLMLCTCACVFRMHPMCVLVFLGYSCVAGSLSRRIDDDTEEMCGSNLEHDQRGAGGARWRQLCGKHPTATGEQPSWQNNPGGDGDYLLRHHPRWGAGGGYKSVVNYQTCMGRLLPGKQLVISPHGKTFLLLAIWSYSIIDFPRFTRSQEGDSLI